MVPQRVLTRSYLLDLLPTKNTQLISATFCEFFKNEVVLIRHIGMTKSFISNDHLMPIAGMLEKIVDSLFLHQTVGKVEIRFAVLDAKIARLKGPRYLI